MNKQQIRRLFFYQHLKKKKITHNTTQHSKYNKTKQQTHTQHLKVQSKGRGRGKDNKNLLAGLLSNTIKPLQIIQNAAARLVFNEPKRTHVTPLFISLHWLPVAARIKFKTLMLAYRTTTGSAPSYFHSLLRIYIPSRSLRSASERRLVVPSQRGLKSLSRTFSFTILDGGIIFPPLSGMLDPCHLQATTENSSLSALLDFILNLKKKTLNLSLYLSLLPLIACTYLNNDRDLVLRALPLSDCLFKMNRFMYSPIVSRFG